MRNKKGYIAISSVFAGCLMILVAWTILSLYLYVQSYTGIKRQVITLADVAQKKGGLTYSDIDEFRTTLGEYGFMAEDGGAIDITLVAKKTGDNLIGVSELGEVGGYYLKSSVDDKMVLIVSTPANKSSLATMLTFLGIDKQVDTYKYKEEIVSKRD